MHFNNFALQHIPVGDVRFIGEASGVLDTIHEIFSKKEEFGISTTVDVGINCHTITRLIARNIPELKVVDGWFYSTCPSREHPEKWNVYSCSHSWLITPSGGTIIDPYPLNLVAVGTIVAIPTQIPEKDLNTCYYGAGNYEEGVLDYHRYDPVGTLLQVLKIEAVLRQIMKKTK